MIELYAKENYDANGNFKGYSIVDKKSGKILIDNINLDTPLERPYNADKKISSNMAFPLESVDWPNSAPGLTKREYVAAKLLSSMFTDQEYWDGTSYVTYSDRVVYAFEVADEFLRKSVADEFLRKSREK